MPSIASRLTDTPVASGTPTTSVATSYKPPLPAADPSLSSILRCPLPNLSTPSTDSLRQYYAGGEVPQYRFNAPNPISNVTSPSASAPIATSSSLGVVEPDGTTLTVDSSGVLSVVPGGSSGVGTVTSVGLAMPVEFIVANSPVKGSGTITVTKATETAGTFYAGPSSGSASVPAFRLLVPSDLPGAQVMAYRSISSPTTITSADWQIEITSGTFTQPLPDATTTPRQAFSIKNSGSGTITISTTSGQNIDGQTTQTLSQWDNLQVMSNGTGWIVI